MPYKCPVYNCNCNPIERVSPFSRSNWSTDGIKKLHDWYTAVYEQRCSFYYCLLRRNKSFRLVSNSRYTKERPVMTVLTSQPIQHSISFSAFYLVSHHTWSKFFREEEVFFFCKSFYSAKYYLSHWPLSLKP